MIDMKTIFTNSTKWLLAASMTAVMTLGSGCAVMREQETVGSYVTDATLTARVKASMVEDKTVDAAAISVETLNGVVQLSGFAKTSAEKSQAERLALKVGGVKSVLNSIAVR
jgi:hyperosmotically inducible periplasmic protein